MHKHRCRHCRKEFLCDEPLDCFKTYVTCTDCFVRRDIPIFVCVLFLGAAAIALTAILFRLSNH